MSSHTPFIANSAPARKGFYDVRLHDGRDVIAEWRSATREAVAGWWIYVNDDPTAEKVAEPLANVVGFRRAERSAVEAALKREPTVAEKIESALAAYARQNRDPHTLKIDPPPARRLAIGDVVTHGPIGVKRTVVALADEGRVAVCSSMPEPKRDNPTPKMSYDAAHWTESVKETVTQQHGLVHDSIASNIFSQGHLEFLLYRRKQGLDDNPTYQRDYVWGGKDKQAFLESVFEGRELGRFIFVRADWPHRDEILDGKQRLNCLWQFYTSEIAYQGVYWHELAVEDRRRILRRVVQSAELPAGSYKTSDLLKIFLEVNTAGVPQTADHLQTVRDQLAVELAREATDVDEPVASPAS